MYDYNAICSRVIDGDTIDAKIDLGFNVWIECRIRFLGVDAPEARTRNLEEKLQGLRTKEYVKEIMSTVGGHFVLKSHGVGKYGRCLGEIFINGENINQKLISEGYAKEYLS